MPPPCFGKCTANMWSILESSRVRQAYYYHYPDDVSVGFPSVYLLKDDEMTEIGGFFALEILESFIEDVDEASVE